LSSVKASDLAHNLRARGAWDEVMDLERALILLRHNGEPIEIATKPPRTQTWTWMARICGELAERLSWGERPGAREYVQRRLGRADPEVGETFLTELSPIPSKNVATNKEWLRAFRQAAPDCDQLISKRLVRLNGIIEQNQPQFVFCYGSEKPENNAKFKRVLPKRSWQRITNKSELCESEGCICVLMPFFGNGRLSNAECQAVIEEILKRRRSIAGLP
jgi:hypothetical protein